MEIGKRLAPVVDALNSLPKILGYRKDMVKRAIDEEVDAQVKREALEEYREFMQAVEREEKERQEREKQQAPPKIEEAPPQPEIPATIEDYDKEITDLEKTINDLKPYLNDEARKEIAAAKLEELEGTLAVLQRDKLFRDGLQELEKEFSALRDRASQNDPELNDKFYQTEALLKKAQGNPKDFIAVTARLQEIMDMDLKPYVRDMTDEEVAKEKELKKVAAKVQAELKLKKSTYEINRQGTASEKPFEYLEEGTIGEKLDQLEEGLRRTMADDKENVNLRWDQVQQFQKAVEDIKVETWLDHFLPMYDPNTPTRSRKQLEKENMDLLLEVIELKEHFDHNIAPEPGRFHRLKVRSRLDLWIEELQYLPHDETLSRKKWQRDLYYLSGQVRMQAYGMKKNMEEIEWRRQHSWYNQEGPSQNTVKRAKVIFAFMQTMSDVLKISGKVMHGGGEAPPPDEFEDMRDAYDQAEDMVDEEYQGEQRMEGPKANAMEAYLVGTTFLGGEKDAQATATDQFMKYVNQNMFNGQLGGMGLEENREALEFAANMSMKANFGYNLEQLRDITTEPVEVFKTPINARTTDMLANFLQFSEENRENIMRSMNQAMSHLSELPLEDQNNVIANGILVAKIFDKVEDYDRLRSSLITIAETSGMDPVEIERNLDLFEDQIVVKPKFQEQEEEKQEIKEEKEKVEEVEEEIKVEDTTEEEEEEELREIEEILQDVPPPNREATKPDMQRLEEIFTASTTLRKDQDFRFVANIVRQMQNIREDSEQTPAEEQQFNELLEELSLLYNALKGDMDIVGNEPQGKPDWLNTLSLGFLGGMQVPDQVHRFDDSSYFAFRERIVQHINSIVNSHPDKYNDQVLVPDVQESLQRAKTDDIHLLAHATLGKANLLLPNYGRLLDNFQLEHQNQLKRLDNQYQVSSFLQNYQTYADADMQNFDRAYNEMLDLATNLFNRHSATNKALTDRFIQEFSQTYLSESKGLDPTLKHQSFADLQQVTLQLVRADAQDAFRDLKVLDEQFKAGSDNFLAELYSKSTKGTIAMMGAQLDELDDSLKTKVAVAISEINRDLEGANNYLMPDRQKLVKIMSAAHRARQMAAVLDQAKRDYITTQLSLWHLELTDAWDRAKMSPDYRKYFYTHRFNWALLLNNKKFRMVWKNGQLSKPLARTALGLTAGGLGGALKGGSAGAIANMVSFSSVAVPEIGKAIMDPEFIMEENNSDLEISATPSRTGIGFDIQIRSGLIEQMKDLFSEPVIDTLKSLQPGYIQLLQSPEDVTPEMMQKMRLVHTATMQAVLRLNQALSMKDSPWVAELRQKVEKLEAQPERTLQEEQDLINLRSTLESMTDVESKMGKMIQKIPDTADMIGDKVRTVKNYLDNIASIQLV